MNEFDLIRRFFLPLSQGGEGAGLVLGVGDDCAIQQVPSGHDLVFSIDTMVEGRHFPKHYNAELLGWRALATATSDLAAMGAVPVCFTLALTLPAADEEWLAAFARGLASASAAFGLVLAGGDTTRGGLALSLQVHGTVERGQALRRSGARPGELICVSGCLGDAGAALDYLAVSNPSDDIRNLLSCYHRPQPRLELGQALVGVASAAIDISDGLMSDLSHILTASGVGATIDRAALPLSAALQRLKGSAAADYALRSGDDYQLCVAIGSAALAKAPQALQNQLTVIGVVEDAPGLRLKGEPEAGHAGVTGFDHFGRSS